MKIRIVALALFGLVGSTVAVKADSQQDQQACMNDVSASRRAYCPTVRASLRSVARRWCISIRERHPFTNRRRILERGSDH